MSSSEATKGGSAKAPTGSKTAPSRKRKESSSAKDSNPSQPLVSKPVDTGMHKEDQQVAGGPTSLGVTSEEGARPQLSSGMSVFSKLKPIYLASVIIHYESVSGYDASANSTAKANPRTSAPIDSLPLQQGKDEGTKNYSLDHIFAGTDPNVLADKTKSISDGLETVLATPKTGTKLMQNQDLDSPKDDPIIVVDDSEEDEEEDKNEEIHSTTNDKTEDISASIPPPQGPFRFKSSQINSLPTELKELPSKFNEITDEVKALKTQVHGHEIEVPWDLKELPTKLEEFTTIVTSLISQVAKLKSLQWELPAEFLLVPNPVASVQAKVKTLDALPCLLLKVTQALNMFAKVLHSASKAGDQRVPLASQANTIPEIEKDAKVKPARHKAEIRKEELIDLFGTEVVNKYYNNKLQYDRYCDKMLNRRAKSRITNYDILTRKGLITLKVYKDNDISEIIPEFKATDLHLSEWREVVKAFRNKKGKGWTSIYKQILERMNYLRTTKAELGIDIDRPLTNKRLKSSVQYEDYPAGTMLNEPILGMILFNSYHRHDFVTIKDFRDFPNTMLYTIQEVFFRLNQGRGFDDHARTFSSLLLAEIDKRNLNPLKQMRVVEMRHRM
ncbi:hypothetical protein Tco_0478576 [Tanacetum coccineum]